MESKFMIEKSALFD